MRGVKKIIKCSQFMVRNRRTPIFLYCSRRGGSTMLMQSLAESTKSRYIDQPFSLYSAENERHMRLIPFSLKSELLFLDSDDERELKDFSMRLVEGGEIFNTAFRPWKKDFHVVSERVLLKITNAKSYIKTFDEWYSPVSILLLRSPIMVAKSCIANGWGLTTSAFLGNRYYCQDVLSPKLLQFCDEVEANGSLLERHVLNWCLDHYLCIKNAPENTLIIKYEDVVSNDKAVMLKLKSLIPELSEERFMESLTRPSKSSKYSQHLRGMKVVSSDSVNSSPYSGLVDDDISGAQRIIAEFRVYDEYY